ncbi:MAG TPA: acetolactate synthase small subunit [Nitratifractor sp.]|nr:acetolactate synthase small subunit [Nitratifractor sp.]HHD74406.1 acetolactate synthase small subunit [Nitratifractor sp.]HHH20664.1 acetolactate synthase small subunit [Nitratifractor sp.]
MQKVRRVISVIVQNEAQVLARVSGLFAGRGYNIDSLTVASIPNSNMSHMTIVTRGSSRVMEQIIKQLHKLIPVYKVIEHDSMVEKEMVLIKFPIEKDTSFANIQALFEAYNGGIVNASDEMIIAMAADESQRICHCVEAANNFNPIEIVRSGVVAMER